jgi:hypothetical protein
MKHFFSAATSGFYCDEIHGDKMPEDALEISDDLYDACRGQQIVAGPDGLPQLYVAPPPNLQQRATVLLAAVDEHLNATAKAMGYDDIRTAVTYADEPAVPKFQAEGQALRAWRSLVYAKCYQVLADVQSGAVDEPNEAQLIAMLPALQLPG